ncbi:MAG TPA: SBBP repeat-containing protein, partial [Bryobacteraceae bacterium]|nr:SBBP repeat-containing protein [Bryobacteraceae bacterium]
QPDEVKKILLNPAGQVAMTGYTMSPDFSITQNALEPVFGGVANAFLSILDLKASQLGVGLTYSTYYGGSGGEVAYDLKLDSAGRYYLGGYTLSPDLPVTPNALSPASDFGGLDGFIAVIDSTKGAKGLVYASYITSNGFQIVYGVDVDSTGNIYVTGLTTSDVFPNASPVNNSPAKYSAFVMTFTLP